MGLQEGLDLDDRLVDQGDLLLGLGLVRRLDLQGQELLELVLGVLVRADRRREIAALARPEVFVEHAEVVVGVAALRIQVARLLVRGLGAVEILQAAPDRAACDAGDLRDRRYPTPSCRPRLARREQTKPSFVEMAGNRLLTHTNGNDVDHAHNIKRIASE